MAINKPAPYYFVYRREGDGYEHIINANSIATVQRLIGVLPGRTTILYRADSLPEAKELLYMDSTPIFDELVEESDPSHPIHDIGLSEEEISIDQEDILPSQG